MIALLEALHGRPDVDDDARALVAEDRGEEALRILARRACGVGVTDARRLDLDEDLALAGALHLNVLDRRASRRPCGPRLRALS